MTSWKLRCRNRPRSIYQYSNMGPRLSGLTSIFGVVFFVFKSPVGIERQKKLEKFAILTRKPRSHAWILIYRTWPINRPNLQTFTYCINLEQKQELWKSSRSPSHRFTGKSEQNILPLINLSHWNPGEKIVWHPRVVRGAIHFGKKFAVHSG